MYLCLSRKVNESICIGEGIEVLVTKIRGDRVWLGVKAPAHVGIHRKEVAEAIKEAGGDPSVRRRKGGGACSP